MAVKHVTKRPEPASSHEDDSVEIVMAALLADLALLGGVVMLGTQMSGDETDPTARTR